MKVKNKIQLFVLLFALYEIKKDAALKQFCLIFILLLSIVFVTNINANCQVIVDSLSAIPMPVDTISKAQLDSINNTTIDSINVEAANKQLNKEREHSPRKASIYSAILPGLGQAYNKKYWKIPIIYAAFGGLGYAISWNNERYSENKQAYKDLTDDDELTDSYKDLEWTRVYDLDDPRSVSNLKDGLIKRQDYYRRNRDLNIIVTAAFYALNIIDANVDAHFFNFDISDDLSMEWQPKLSTVQNQNYYSFNCKINF